jgi:hypothetical protein
VADDNTVGASGLWDPKELMVGDVSFHTFETKGFLGERVPLNGG